MFFSNEVDCVVPDSYSYFLNFYTLLLAKFLLLLVIDSYSYAGPNKNLGGGIPLLFLTLSLENKKFETFGSALND